jgi:hypothetical protein
MMLLAAASSAANAAVPPLAEHIDKQLERRSGAPIHAVAKAAAIEKSAGVADRKVRIFDNSL